MFFREIPALLGIADSYAQILVKIPPSKKYDYLATYDFPKPWITSEDGIRMWRRDDLERWAADARRKRNFASKHFAPLLDDAALADRLLGRDR